MLPILAFKLTTSPSRVQRRHHSGTPLPGLVATAVVNAGCYLLFVIVVVVAHSGSRSVHLSGSQSLDITNYSRKAV